MITSHDHDHVPVIDHDHPPLPPFPVLSPPRCAGDRIGFRRRAAPRRDHDHVPVIDRDHVPVIDQERESEKERKRERESERERERERERGRERERERERGEIKYIDIETEKGGEDWRVPIPKE